MSSSFDFRSDTVTQPTPAMLQAMTTARLGDDVFGDDPTVHRLEEEVAAKLGKESAVFVATGTMSNQIALRTHVSALDEILCDYRSHIHVWEVGAVHASGAAIAPVDPGAHGEAFLTPALIKDNVRTDNCLYHQPVTKLLSLENTMNGAIMPQAQLEASVAAARSLGLACHLDGARLFNAVVGSGVSAAEIAAPFDTVSVCLSKALGAPVGSVLVGPAAQIDRAKHYRKYYGGGWRQAGLLAAAGLYALEHNIERLAEDHAAAAELASGLLDLGFSVQPPQTNMVWCAPPPSVDQAAFRDIVATLERDDGIRIGAPYVGPIGRQPFGEAAKAMRFVTHMQTPKATAVKALLDGFTRLLRRV